MDEGIGVQAFECSCGAQAVDFGDVEHGCGLDKQKRPKALAGTQEGIAHGRQQAWGGGGMGQQLVQAVLDGLCTLAQSLGKLDLRQLLAPVEAQCDKGRQRQS